jgi:hypothetical protein
MASQEFNDEPFMEHPTGQFASSVDAMADAIERLRAKPTDERWIVFSAQGQGHDPDSYTFAEIRLNRDTLEINGDPLDVPKIVNEAGADPLSLTGNGERYSIAAASPKRAAQIMDAIYRYHFGIRPFADEGDDYAVGAEWLD